MEFLLPRSSTYVVVQIDAVETVKPLNDPALTAAAQRLQTQNYVGYVLEIQELPLPNNPDHKCRMALVGQGLCKNNEEFLADSTMCIPIFPTTEHPLSRKPLYPTPSFPFADCYQYTFATPLVRIPNRRYNHQNSISLPSQYSMASILYISEDRRRMQARKNAREGTVLQQRVDAPEESLPVRSLNRSEDRDQESQGAQVLCTNDRVVGNTGSVADKSDHAVEGNVPPSDETTSNEHAPINREENLNVSSGGDAPADSGAPAVEEVSPALQEHSSERVDSSSEPCSPYTVTSLFVVVSESDDTQSRPVGEDARERPSLHATDPPSSPVRVVPCAEDSGGDDTSSVIQSISDRSATTSHLVAQVFLGNTRGNRYLIPLVNVSMDICEVSEVNDPIGFLEEANELLRLMLEWREGALAQAHSKSEDSLGTESWVDLAKDTSIGDQGEDQAKRPKFRRLLYDGRSKLTARTRQAWRRCAAILRGAKAVVTCSFSVHVEFSLNTD